jgi:carbonic anhydrase/acetyltransferase-like protein (isoleucine patch superfamily)
MRTIPDSVTPASGPPPDHAALAQALAALATRYPGARFDRYLGRIPEVDPSAWIAPGAHLIGDVRVGPEASIWPGCVLRADLNAIVIGPRTNLQDGVVVHLGDADPTIVGADVTVGHRAVLHGCQIEDAVLVGIQSTVLDGAQIGAGSVIGAGAVVPAATVAPPGSLLLGVPARPGRAADPAAADFHRRLAGKYVRLAHNHRHG